MKRIREIAWTLAPLTSLFWLVGCWTGPQGESTEGRLGNVYFSYTRSAGCELGCKMDRPLVPQAQEVLIAHLSQKQGRVKVVSNQPSTVKIVRVETQRVCLNALTEPGTGLSRATLINPQNTNANCDTEFQTRLRITIEAKKAGKAEIQLQYQNNKTLLDAVPVTIETPKSLRIELTRIQSKASTSKATSVDPLSLEANGARYRLRILVLTKEGSLVETMPALKMELPKQQKVVRFSGQTKGSDSLQIFPRHNETTLVTGDSGQTLLNIRVHKLQRQLALRVVR
jgi:hypothetical protein